MASRLQLPGEMSTSEPVAATRPVPARPAPVAGGTRPARLHKRRRGWLAWLAAVVVLAAGGFLLLRTRREAPVPVYTARVERGPVRDFVTSVGAGRVAAKTEVTLRAEIAGKVVTVHRRRGERVAAGEPLVSYDAAELRDRLHVAQAAVELGRAQARQAEQSAATAEAEAARARRLSESGAVPAAQRDTAEGQAKVLARAAEAARAAAAQARANLDLARATLGKAVVRAPFSGTVLTTAVEPGDVTAPGAPLVGVADASELHVDAEPDEADVGRVAAGMPVDLSFDALPGERIRGTLRQIAPSVTRDPRGGRSVAVAVMLPHDPRLLVGMSADVDVIVATRESTSWLPPNAVLGRGAKRTVYAIEDGVARKREVEVGISTWEAVEIKSGVAEGAEVVASLSTGQVTDGARVQPKERPGGGSP